MQPLATTITSSSPGTGDSHKRPKQPPDHASLVVRGNDNTYHIGKYAYPDRLCQGSAVKEETAVGEIEIQATADVDGRAVLGPGTTVWHLAQIREDARLGRDCIVGRGAYVGPGVTIGDHVKLQNYALVYEPRGWRTGCSSARPRC